MRLEVRRQQSDAASREIGTMLLQGWALLGDDCPNTNCLGIPLMRPPAASKDLRKFCVVCRQYYGDDNRPSAQQPAQQPSTSSPAQTQQEEAPEPAKPARRRFDNAAIQNSRRHAVHAATAPSTVDNTNYENALATAKNTTVPTTIASKSLVSTDTSDTWSRSSAALEQAALRLTQQLENYTANSVVPVDPQAIGHIADALVKLSSAYSTLKNN